MKKLSLELEDTKALALAKLCKSSGKSPNEIIGELITEHLRLPSLVSAPFVDSITNKLIGQYRKYYKARFNLDPPGQNGAAYSLIRSYFEENAQSDVGATKLYTLLDNAILWYLYYHDNTSPTGTTYPYGLKYLFSENSAWLLRTCIESAQKTDMAIFEAMKTRGLTRDEAIRALKRGDIYSSGNGLTVKVEKILERVEEIVPKLPKNADIYSQKEIKLFYESNSKPTIEDIDVANKLLDKIEMMLNG